MDWKKAHITPIFKSGSAEEASNYRPISILPICMKIFVHAVHFQLYVFVQEYSLLCENQSGFRQKYSTCTALTEITDIILGNMNRGPLTSAVYLDLKNVFDTVYYVYC